MNQRTSDPNIQYSPPDSPPEPPPFRCWKCGGRKLVANRLDDEKVDCTTCGDTYETKDIE
jgi:hypothetical protein